MERKSVVGPIKSALGLSSLALVALAPAAARAQTEAPPAPTTEAAPATPESTDIPPTPPAPAPAPPPAVPPIAAPPPAATVAADAAPAEDDDKKYQTFSQAIWMRIGSRVQGARDPSKGDDVSGTAEVDAIFGGRVHKAIGWQANFVGTIGREGETAASILDLHAKFELHDLANLWVGRMLVPSDRSNFSGPWFTSPWHYPGVFGSTFIGPKTGKFGRDNGATFWGQVMGGHFKYYVGAYDLQDANNSPLYSGRISISLLNPEPGYYHSSTYYGEKDIVALGVGFQSQKNGVVTRDMMGNVVTSEDLVTFNTDLLVEKKLGGAGTVTGEAAYFKFNDKQATDYYYLALLSYLAPKKLGWGYLQPLVRLQQAKPRGAADDMWTLFDGQLGYVISQYAARLALGYQRTDMGTMNGNAFFAGVQLQR